MNITKHNIINIGIAPVRHVNTSNYGQQIQLIAPVKWQLLHGAYLHGSVDIREKETKGNVRLDISISTKILEEKQGLSALQGDKYFVCFIEYPGHYFKFFGSKNNPLSKTVRYRGDYQNITLKQSALFDSKPLYLPDFIVL